MSAPERQAGAVVDVVGPVVRVRADRPVAVGEVMWVGDDRLYGEVIALEGRGATLQVYESSAGLYAGAPVAASGHPLRVELGPGLIGGVFDGLQRPLAALAATDGDFLRRGRHLRALDSDRTWHFVPEVREGETLRPGTPIGTVAEAPSVRHRVLTPAGVSGRVRRVAAEGGYRAADVVAWVGGDGRTDQPIGLSHEWPVRKPRPFARRLALSEPLMTGQRVLDTFFPVPAGGTVAMPGGFGTGKTVLQHQLCKWAEADVIVFVGCGERGNEMAEVLTELPSLVDPRTGRPLCERTVLIANTSDMPVAAREASIYVGVTIAEYYRDMGNRVVLLADSTSRWAEALREISGRLEEMPAEEGYPSYLAARLADFYERAGRVVGLSGEEGSLTIVGAISPAGGDLTEPVTRHSERLARTVWSLDRALAQARQFPAVSVVRSHSDAARGLAGWWERELGVDWWKARGEALAILAEADRLEATARLVGSASLPERQQLVLALGRLIEDGFLRQYAGGTDDWCSARRQYALLDLLRQVAVRARAAVDAGVFSSAVLELPALGAIRRASATIAETDVAAIAALGAAFHRECDGLVAAGAGR